MYTFKEFFIWLISKLTTGPDFDENKLLQTSVATLYYDRLDKCSMGYHMGTEPVVDFDFSHMIWFWIFFMLNSLKVHTISNCYPFDFVLKYFWILSQKCNISHQKQRLHHKFYIPWQTRWSYKTYYHLWFFPKCCFVHRFLKMVFKDFQMFKFSKINQ